MTVWSRKSAQRFLAFFFVMTACCFAQFSASVQGTVTDLSGASIPRATVTLTNTAAHVTQTATSDNSGVYRFSRLAPEQYTISLKSQGFSVSKVDFRQETAESKS